MRAAVVHAPGGPEVLQIEERPIPEPRPGWVLVRVRAFGLNRSELETRRGGSGDAVPFPRVLGIECVGEAQGETVIAAMGEMGRKFDGGYQEYALLPEERVIPVRTTLDWPRLGAIPETFGTAWGSLATLDLRAGETLLVRGATSSVGMAAITLAKDRGVEVFATTRQESKRPALEANGADHVIVDDGAAGARVREIVPDGVDALFELVGPGTAVDSLQAVRPGGRACMSGYLEGSWDRTPAEAEARRLGVPLHGFGSSAITRDSYGEILQGIVEGVESGRYRANLDRTFPLEQIADAHRYMEANRAAGKVVGLT